MLFFLLACNIDLTTANGELGRLSYSLGTGYFVDGNDLTQEEIVTGHLQSFAVSLSNKGVRDAGKHAFEITHTISPNTGVEFVEEEISDEDDNRPPNFSLVVHDPGTYTIESQLDGDEFDRVTFQFAEPVALEMVTWARAPYAEDFQSASDGDSLEEGTQLAFLGIPLNDKGDRLVGDIQTDFTADPATSVVPAQNVYDVNETDTINSESVPSLYFIEPGDITVTLSDTVNPAKAQSQFHIRSVSPS
jgi:hypothetical protein